VPGLQQEAIDPQMGNVLVPLALSPEQLELLGRAGVAASPADYPEFHVLYQESERNNLPLFVTSDALLHIFHLTFDQLLSKLEEEVFLAKLHELNQALLAEAESKLKNSKARPGKMLPGGPRLSWRWGAGWQTPNSNSRRAWKTWRRQNWT